MPASPSSVVEPDGESWRLTDESTETVFELANVRVVGRTRLYEDAELRAAVRSATDGALDQPWRFLFSMELSFRPPLAPGVGPAALFSTVVAASRREFGDDLRERGFRDVERGRRERMRTESGTRARLTKYEATFPLGGELGDDDAAGGANRIPDEPVVRVEGWLSVWPADGTFHLAGGVYPTSGLDAVAPGVVDDPGRYRRELLSLLRSV